MTEKFGPFFRNLYLDIHCYTHEIPDEFRGVIRRLSDICRLDKFVLNIDPMLFQPTYIDFHSRESDLQVFTDFLKNVPSLNSYTLLCWYNLKHQQSC